MGGRGVLLLLNVTMCEICVGLVYSRIGEFLGNWKEFKSLGIL